MSRTVVLAAVLAVGGSSAVPAAWSAERPAPAVAAQAAPAPAVAAPAAPAATLFPCRGYAPFDEQNPAAAVMADRFTWSPFRSVRVGDGRGNINWRTDPYRHHTWQMWLHSLRWLGSLIQRAPGDRAATGHALAVVRDWMRDNPYPWARNPSAREPTMHRLNVLLCLRRALTDQGRRPLPASLRWLDGTIVTHLRFIQRYWSGYANHGTDESDAMLAAACTLGSASYRNLATSRLASALGVAVSPQGATNEQSTGYANMNYNLWGRAAGTLERCGTATTRVVSRRVLARIRPMTTFLALATTPQGTLEQIGDTQRLRYSPIVGSPQQYPATLGRQGRPPAQRVIVYRNGYVFGRSNWGRATQPFPYTTHYTIRFGPARQWHGHNDHLGLTLSALGSQVLIDPGYGTPGRRTTLAFMGPYGHNTLTVPGMSINAAPTALTRAATTGTYETYALSDRPARGVTRQRFVLADHVNPRAAVMVVRDVARAARATSFTQNWQHPVGARVVQLDRSTRMITHGATRSYVITLSRHSTSTATNPHYVQFFNPKPHPTTRISQSRTRRADILTVVVVTAAGAARPRVVAGRTGLTVTVAGITTGYTVGRGGFLTRSSVRTATAPRTRAQADAERLVPIPQQPAPGLDPWVGKPGTGQLYPLD